MHGKRFVVSADVLRTELRVGMYDSHPNIPETAELFLVVLEEFALLTTLFLSNRVDLVPETG
jgi:hypothetical protein